MLLQIEHINNTCFLRLTPLHVMHSFYVRKFISQSVLRVERRRKNNWCSLCLLVFIWWIQWTWIWTFVWKDICFRKKRRRRIDCWRKKFAIYIFLLFCNMSNDQIFYHYYNVWQSHLFALFIDFSTHSLFYCLQWWHGLVVNIQEITKVLSLSDYRRIVDKL